MATNRKSVKTKKTTTTPPAAASNKRPMQPHAMVMSPSIQGAVSIHAWSKFLGDVDLNELITGLRERVAQVQGGDMRTVEAMLYGQAMTLQTIFTSLARKAVAQDYLKQFQVNLTLALKAQAQCRATLEALAEIKNPRPVMFAKQANVTSGPQQVNNAAAPVSANLHARTEQTTSLQNELLEAPHGNLLDARTPSTASGADSHLEAVGAGHRAAHG